MGNNDKNGRIVVVGSSNTDMVIRVDHLPRPGETIIGHDFITNQGDKGANQAVAVSRMGGNVTFVARLGDDGFGHQTMNLLKHEGIDTNFVLFTEGVATGIAMIPVDSHGENSIIVAGGANALLSADDIDAAGNAIKQAQVLLMQLETPVPTLIHAAQIAHRAGVKVILNPAPFPKDPLPTQLLENVDIITPNETEAQMMSGVEICDEQSIMLAINKIQAIGVQQVIITAGSKGAYTSIDGELVRVEAFPVKAVDTTAAGDTFNGTLCVALCEGAALPDAIRLANKAAALSVTRLGAWRSIPRREELTNF